MNGHSIARRLDRLEQRRRAGSPPDVETMTDDELDPDGHLRAMSDADLMALIEERRAEQAHDREGHHDQHDDD